MEAELSEIVVNGVCYVKKSDVQNMAQTVGGMVYVIVRTYSAGVHVGYLSKREGKEIVLKNARRIWYWDGAASLSQMAVSGVSRPDTCKFSVVVPEITLTEAIEIIPCTEAASKNIAGVRIWSE